jgi:hypothetical protein
MNATTPNTWHEANQRYLMAALAVVKELLERHAARVNGNAGANSSAHPQSSAAQQALKQAADSLPSPSALDTLCAAFALSPFERDVLLLCAGLELDSTFAAFCAAQGNQWRAYPTFSLALATFSDPHWSALSPAAPLRYWHIIEVEPGVSLTTSQLCIDERTLHYLTGLADLDGRLQGVVEPLDPCAELVPSHDALVRQLVALWSQTEQAWNWPAVQLCGPDNIGKGDIAATACAELVHLPRNSYTPQAVKGLPA